MPLRGLPVLLPPRFPRAPLAAPRFATNFDLVFAPNCRVRSLGSVAVKRYEWESQRLRDAKFDFDAFMPDMEGDADGTLRASRRRLVYMPYIAAFGCDNLPDLLGGDIKVPIGGLRFWASPAACNRLQPGCSLQPSAAWLQPAT